MCETEGSESRRQLEGADDEAAIERRRRREFIRLQDARRRAYREETSLKVFPLQAMAMEDHDELMRGYRRSDDGDGAEADEGDDDVTSDEDAREKLGRMGRLNQRPRDADAAPESSSPVYSSSTPPVSTSVSPPPPCVSPPPPPSAPSSSSSLWSMEPRLFAMETSLGGRRRYISCHLGRFMDRYWRECDVDSRHYYELIREGAPCRLYFDLEFAKFPNPNLSPDITERVLHELFDELVREFRIVYDVVDVPPDRSTLVDLDSSTSAKFSRHWILHLPGGALFPDARDAGIFVRGFVSRLIEERSNGELRSRGRGLLADNLLVYADNVDATENVNDDDDDKKGRRQTHFIDTGVYTRNRIFRLLGSTKFGKPTNAALRIADTNRYPFPIGFDNTKFYRPAITSGERSSSIDPSDGKCTGDEAAVAVNDDGDFEAFRNSLSWEDHAAAMAATLIVPADASRMDYPILKSLIDRSRDDGTCVTSRLPRTDAPSYGTSPFPALEGWILRTLGRREGLVGSISTWSIVGRHPLPRTVCFNMKNNRYCGNVRRAHKSNNILWNVHLADRVCWQGCHDPECWGYRGEPIDLPDDVNVEIDEFLLEFELSSLSENAAVEMRSTQQTAHDGDGEFDDILLEAAMRQLDLSSICQERDGANASLLNTRGEPYPSLRSLHDEVDTSSINSVNGALTNIDTSSIESPRSEDIGRVEKKENPTAHDGDGEFDNAQLEDAMRQLDLSSICKTKESVERYSEI